MIKRILSMIFITALFLVAVPAETMAFDRDDALLVIAGVALLDVAKDRGGYNQPYRSSYRSWRRPYYRLSYQIGRIERDIYRLEYDIYRTQRDWDMLRRDVRSFGKRDSNCRYSLRCTS